MKEATGELNMTVVTVVAIAAVGAFFYAFVWPAIEGSIKSSTYCASAFNCVEDTTGGTTSGNLICDYYDENGDVVSAGVSCPDEYSG